MKKETGEKTYELKYTGYLMNADNLYLHYGYTNWSDVSEKKMRKLKSCYKIEVSLPANSELNFCFRANENEWDNNYGKNYWYSPNSNENYEFVEITGKALAAKKTEPKATVKTTTKAATKKTTSAAKTTSKAKITSKTTKK